MHLPDLPDIITATENISCKMLDSKWTPKVLIVLTALALGFLIGVEAVRTVTGS
jgi:hypothetical protein